MIAPFVWWPHSWGAIGTSTSSIRLFLCLLPPLLLLLQRPLQQLQRQPQVRRLAWIITFRRRHQHRGTDEGRCNALPRRRRLSERGPREPAHRQRLLTHPGSRRRILAQRGISGSSAESLRCSPTRLLPACRRPQPIRGVIGIGKLEFSYRFRDTWEDWASLWIADTMLHSGAAPRHHPSSKRAVTKTTWMILPCYNVCHHVRLRVVYVR